MEEERIMKVKVQSETTSSTIIYNIKSARQVRYVQYVLERKFNCYRYTPLPPIYQVFMGFLLRH